MTDLKDRFRRLDDLGVPDVWHQVEAIGPRHPEEPGPSPTRRAGIVAVSLVVAAAGIGLAVVRFDQGTPPVQTGMTPKENGALYYRIGGGDGPSWWESIGEDGTDRSVVFPAYTTINHDDVAWSPDGSRIAFANTIGSRDPGIYTSGPDGSDAVRLTDRADDLWPSWSPDGTRLAFTRSEPGADCLPADPGSRALLCASEVYVMNTDGSDLHALITTERHESQPIWSPDGTRLAFVSTLGFGTRTAVFLANEDGSGVHPVSSADGGSDFSPSWSPDGSRLVFASLRNEDWGIWIVSTDGSSERQLLGSDGGPYMEDPVWSPDGTAIGFVGDPQLAGADGAEPALLVMNADASHVRILARAPSYGVAGDIAWQPLVPGSSTPSPGLIVDLAVPDGAIVFSRSTGDATEAKSNLYFVSPQGATARPITDVSPGAAAAEASWAPDGLHLAFVMGPADHVHRYAGDANLFVLDLATGQLAQLTVGLDVATPAWSPNGQQIAYVAGQGSSLEVISADGTGRHLIADARGYYQRPSWSPDGALIAFQSSPDRATEQTAVFTIRTDGTEERQLTPGTASEGFPSWSPDGRQIAYAAAERLWVMDADGSHERAIGEECHLPCVADFSPTWSPDSGSIAFVRQEEGGAARRLYVIDLSNSAIRALTPDLRWSGDPAWRPRPD